MEATIHVDRLALRGRPEGNPVLQQTWENLLFLHWPIRPGFLRSLIPRELDLDMFDGMAWIGITPFATTHLKLKSIPAVPGMDSFDELNVRAYVLHHGVPGIWFLSLEASKLLMASAARMLFGVPYHYADIQFVGDGKEFSYDLRHPGSPEVRFHVRWRVGMRLRAPDLHSLGFFLVERYCYFTRESGRIHATRVYHSPWILEEAFISEYASNLLNSLRLPEPGVAPLAHFSRSIQVDVWSPKPMIEVRT